MWRDILGQSLTLPCAGDTNNIDNSSDSQLLTSVLRHLATGSLILVACLVDRVPHFADPPSSFIAATPKAEIPENASDPVSLPSVKLLNEWSPPSLDSRPDLAAINAAGCLWALEEIWQEVQESRNANFTATFPLMNGFSGNDHPHLFGQPAAKVPMRWVLCANLEASPTSPAYQIFKDGYPSDESIARLRAIRNVHLKDHNILDATVRQNIFVSYMKHFICPVGAPWTPLQLINFCGLYFKTSTKSKHYHFVPAFFNCIIFSFF